MNRMEAIAARAAAATPGPWDRAWYSGQYNCDCAPSKGALLGTHTGYQYNKRGDLVHIHEIHRFSDPHQITGADFSEVAGNYAFDSGGILGDADAEFIAHTRTDVPALVEAAAAVVALVDAELAEPWDERTERFARRIRDLYTDLLAEETP